MNTEIPLPNANTQRVLFYAFCLRRSQLSARSHYTQIIMYMWFVCRWNLLYAFFSNYLFGPKKFICKYLMERDGGRESKRERESKMLFNPVSIRIGQFGTAKWSTANIFRSAKYLHGIYVKWKQNRLARASMALAGLCNAIRLFLAWSRRLFMATSRCCE